VWAPLWVSSELQTTKNSQLGLKRMRLKRMRLQRMRLQRLNPQARFEDWIADYHPDNVIPPGRDLRGLPTIDRRHYHERSDHRAIWNEHVSDQSRHV
jgi:hypothetical protein